MKNVKCKINILFLVDNIYILSTDLQAKEFTTMYHSIGILCIICDQENDY